MRTPYPIPGSEQLEITDPQMRIILGIVRGETTDQIAATELVSPDTIKTHLRILMRRSGTNTRAHLIAWAYESGLLRPHWSRPYRRAHPS